MRGGLATVAAAALASTVLAVTPAEGQIPYYSLDPGTRVGSLDFSFPHGRTFSDGELLSHMVLHRPGTLAGLRSSLSFLPLISPPKPAPFTPLDLQKDVARLRRFYGRSGFLGTHVTYTVTYDRHNDEVAVHLIVDEGRPVVFDSLRVVTPDGGDPAEALPDSLHPSWSGVLTRARASLGHRFQESARARIVGDLTGWWTDRGWAFARSDTRLAVDTAAAAATLTVVLDPGPRARIGRIEVEGNRHVSDDLILRALPFHTGDLFSADALAEGQRRLFALDLFRLALVSAPDNQPRDSTVSVRVRVQENPPRLVTGELGYVSSGGGVTARAEVADRNVLGRAQTLRLDALAQTGKLSWTERPQREYQLTASYRRPFTLDPRMTLTLAPFARYRDNLADRSSEAGWTSTLVYRWGAKRFLSLQHSFSARHVLDYRLGSANALDLATLMRLVGGGALDALGHHVDRSVFGLSATLGGFDPGTSHRSLRIRPSIEITAPGRWNTVEYARVDLPVATYVPLGGRFALAGRVRAGRVFPFGKTVTDSVSGLLREVRLRDVLLTAGGTGSVRGWGTGLVGPKFPNLVFTGDRIDTAHVATDGYYPAGGLARISTSLELRMPFPGLGPRWGTHVFLDGARVWTPDHRFGGADPYHQERWFWGTGFGIDVASPVGPIRLGVGYKLNPSPLDVRDPRAVFTAISNDKPISSVPTHWIRRLHLHIALGSPF